MTPQTIAQRLVRVHFLVHEASNATAALVAEPWDTERRVGVHDALEEVVVGLLRARNALLALDAEHTQADA